MDKGNKGKVSTTRKKQQIIHILWISVLPSLPPLTTLAKVNNIHTKEFFIHICGPPLPPLALSTFIKINNIVFFFFFLTFLDFFSLLYLDIC